MRKPIRVAGIVLKGEGILLMHRINKGKEYFVFPGGGVEDEETTEETVLRELHEETSTKVRVKKLLYHHHIIGEVADSDQYFYLCDYVSGDIKLGNSNESRDMEKGENFYEPIWLPIGELGKTLVYPLEIRDWLIDDLEKGFKDETRGETIKQSDLRQDS
jgi:ADP-ribose pyrophosphatase YjhB (NUDIX family)